MTKQEEWNEFLDSMINNAINQYKTTPEYEYIEKQYEEIEMLLRDNLTAHQKVLVEECQFDLGLIANRESELLYKQGMKDCVFLLKELGVLA